MFGETIANPALTVLDIELFAKVAHEHGVPLVVDNTFPTPVTARPIEWGADIVTHSTTKYMDGHGAALGGAIIDGGHFDWMARKDRYPGLAPQMKAITELHMLRNLEKKAHSSRNVPLSLCVISVPCSPRTVLSS